MTNKEIAQKLGISPAALSLIINHKPGVSDATRTAVLAELEKMGMEHIIKKAPTAVLNNSLCFVIYKKHGKILDTHPFFLLLIEDIETRARSFGYNTLICTIDNRAPIEPQIEHLNMLGAQGAVLFSTEMSFEDLDAFRSLQIPYVTLDNFFVNIPCTSVAINNQMGTYQAVEHLITLGHRHIGYLRAKTRISSFIERELGYHDALKFFGLSLSDSDIWDISYTEEESYRDMKEMLAQERKLPDAFVCDDDSSAVGAMRALSEAGFSIPDDISIIGFNDRPSCQSTLPTMTTVNVPKRTLSYAAVDELINLIENSDSDTETTRSRKVRISTRLVERDSTASRK